MKNNSDFKAVANGSDSSKVANMTWYLGGPGSNYETDSTIKYYTAERNGTVYGSNPKTDTGTVGLMYASDYGFTFKDVDTTCYNTPYKCYSDGGGDPTKSWMLSEKWQWTLTLRSNTAGYTFYIYKNGSVGSSWAYEHCIVRPVVYLKFSVKITGGLGTSGSMYELG